MSEIVLVEPARGGRISGGYVYNERMAAHDAWRLLSVSPTQLGTLESSLDEVSLVLFDSIFLTEEHIGFFVDLQERGRRVGVMLHSFPSMIRAAETGAPPVTHPTRFEVETLQRFGLLVTLGDHYPRMLRGHGIDVVLAPPGVDDAWRKPPRQRRERCRFVSVGSVTRRKGFLDAARVFGERKESDFEWHVAGSLELDQDYARLVTETLPGDQNVHFWGQLAPERTCQLVRDSDVLLMPSYDENHPLVLIEAIAASVPAVVYAAGAAASIVGHERCGLVAPIGDVQRFGEHLDRLIRDEELRFAFAKACFERQGEISNWRNAARLARARLGGVV